MGGLGLDLGHFWSYRTWIGQSRFGGLGLDLGHFQEEEQDLAIWGSGHIGRSGPGFGQY